jgi:hypothetical protein
MGKRAVIGWARAAPVPAAAGRGDSGRGRRRGHEGGVPRRASAPRDVAGAAPHCHRRGVAIAVPVCEPKSHR